MDPKRVSVLNATVAHLISLAYVHKDQSVPGCRDGFLPGLPEWAKSERFDIEAVVPDGPPINTPGKCCDMKMPTPRLEGMLRHMLADRFGLVVRRDLEEMNVYVLSAAKGGPKLTAAKEGERGGLGHVGTFGTYPGVLNYPPKHNYEPEQIVAIVSGRASSMDYMADQIRIIVGRPVLNRTGIPGDFNYEVVFSPLKLSAEIDAARIETGRVPLPVMSKPSIFAALEEDLGLELKASKEKVEVLVIERLARPSEN